MKINKKEIGLLNDYYNAANYLSVGQLYLMDNPLLKCELKLSDIKPKIVGHWGTVPGQNFIYTHLNRIIKKNDLNMIYISGPGHGGNAITSNTYLEGSYSTIYPDITEDENGLKKLMKQFSFPKGISSHVSPETPGSINEGGELGYSLSHAYGTILDNPSLIAACVIGDGEAETGPLAASWQLNKFINPKNDGIVLPILHLNGFKINNPSIMSRITKDELLDYFWGLGYHPYYVNGINEEELHINMANVLDKCVVDIKKIKYMARKKVFRPIYPMIIFESLKGMSGPKEIVGTYKSHQIPFSVTNEEELKKLESWLQSYHPENIFDESGSLKKELKELRPPKYRLMGLNKVSNGGLLLKDLKLPDFVKYGINLKNHGELKVQDMLELGAYLKDVFLLNKKNKNFRIFGPDEAISNRLNYIFDAENKMWNAKIKSNDLMLNSDGRILDGVLSEHLCEGMLEGYLLSGRHGIMHSYEAFIRIVDSMTSQHAKWIKVCKELPWRKDISSLNYILTSHVWQQDHNGFTHQDPGFLNHIVTKKSDIIRIYLPYDANSLICCTDHILKTKNYINVIIASKHPSFQWLNMKDTISHCTKGVGVWKWASINDYKNPDVVLACAGDTPTVEILAASSIIKKYMPKINLRVVNVIDLMKLESHNKHPHGLSDKEYDNIFTKKSPIIFNFHGYPSLIHQLVYNRTNRNIHVHGYNEEGTITTSFDMRVQNKIDRYNIILDVLKYIKNPSAELEQYCENMLKKHNNYIGVYGKDIPEVLEWKW